MSEKLNTEDMTEEFSVQEPVEETKEEPELRAEESAAAEEKLPEEEAAPREKLSLSERIKNYRLEQAVAGARRRRARSENKKNYMSFLRHSPSPIFITEDKKDEYRSMRRLGHLRVALGVTVVLLVLVAGAVFLFDNMLPKAKEEGSSAGAETVKPVDIPRDDFEPVSYDADTGLAVYDDNFNLFIVSERSPLPEDYEIETEKYMGVQVDEKIVSALNLMVKDIEAAGIVVSFDRGYISYDDQMKLYEQEVERLKKKGYTHLMAQNKAMENVSYPGVSDYHTGLSVKIKSGKDFKRTKVYKWLTENAADYGFIFRYPEGKEAHTGGEDLTVIRYVGRTNAVRMRQLSMCLEEYTDYLGSR